MTPARHPRLKYDRMRLQLDTRIERAWIHRTTLLIPLLHSVGWFPEADGLKQALALVEQVTRQLKARTP